MRNLQSNRLLFELTKTDRCAVTLPECDVPEIDIDELLPESTIAAELPNLPELAEPDVVRHFTNLSTLNMSVDTHYYPLGSCTMKHNPRLNDAATILDVEFYDLVQMTAAVDDQSVIDRLAALRCASASSEQWCARLLRDIERGPHIIECFRYQNGMREHLIHGCIGGVSAATEVVEQQLALDMAAQLLRQRVTGFRGHGAV